MAGFDSLRLPSLIALAPLVPQLLNWPAHIVDASRTLPSGLLQLTCSAWRFNGGGELRMAWISSPKIQVFTCFAYPGEQSSQAMYAMEFVQLGTRPIVAVLDFACAQGAEPTAQAQHWLADARIQHAIEANAQDAPEWFVECRSANNIFLRPASASHFGALGLLHLDLLGRWCAAVGGDIASGGQQISDARFNDYKHHHRMNSPGLPLMEKNFGVQWTSDFLDTYFFR